MQKALLCKAFYNPVKDIEDLKKIPEPNWEELKGKID